MNETKVSLRAREFVPLADRLHYMQMFRVTVASVVALYVLVASQTVRVEKTDVARWTGAYLLFSLAGEAVWRLWRKRGITLFGAMIIVDGFYLAWASYATGSSWSPLRYLIILHLIAVALLASYRTGLKLALWHSLLLLAVYHLQEARILRPLEGGPIGGSEYGRLLAFVAGFWLVAIATASFSAVNERELRRRKFDLEALASMTRALQATTESSAVASILIESLADAFAFRRALALRIHNRGLTLIAARGTGQHPESLSAPQWGGVIAEAVKEKRMLLVPALDPDEDPYLSTLLPSAINLLIVPLFGERQPIGVTVLEYGRTKGSRIDRRILSIVEQFAAQAALALRNAWLLQEVKKMALTDGLTLIANRLAFETGLKRELNRATKEGQALALIMLDIDHFKQLNDKHGHQVGDEVLCEVADVLARECRDGDIVARYGGEEFAVIAPGSTEIQAVAIAERLRGAVAASRTRIPVTVSAGVAVCPTHAADHAGLLKAADDGLYASKRAGRNRVSVSERRNERKVSEPQRPSDGSALGDPHDSPDTVPGSNGVNIRRQVGA